MFSTLWKQISISESHLIVVCKCFETGQIENSAVLIESSYITGIFWLTDQLTYQLIDWTVFYATFIISVASWQ